MAAASGEAAGGENAQDGHGKAPVPVPSPKFAGAKNNTDEAESDGGGPKKDKPTFPPPLTSVTRDVSNPDDRLREKLVNDVAARNNSGASSNQRPHPPKTPPTGLTRDVSNPDERLREKLNNDSAARNSSGANNPTFPPPLTSITRDVSNPDERLREKLKNESTRNNNGVNNPTTHPPPTISTGRLRRGVSASSAASAVTAGSSPEDRLWEKLARDDKIKDDEGSAATTNLLPSTEAARQRWIARKDEKKRTSRRDGAEEGTSRAHAAIQAWAARKKVNEEEKAEIAAFDNGAPTTTVDSRATYASAVEGANAGGVATTRPGAVMVPCLAPRPSGIPSSSAAADPVTAAGSDDGDNRSAMHALTAFVAPSLRDSATAGEVVEGVVFRDKSKAKKAKRLRWRLITRKKTEKKDAKEKIEIGADPCNTCNEPSRLTYELGVPDLRNSSQSSVVVPSSSSAVDSGTDAGGDDDSSSSPMPVAKPLSEETKDEAIVIVVATATDPMYHRRGHRSNSLALREAPTHMLMSDQLSFDDLDDIPESASSRGNRYKKGDSDDRGSSKIGCLLRPCLNPKFSLRTQMMMSFGSVSAATIALVMILAIITSIVAGNSIKSESTASLEDWVKDSLGTSARFVAETIEEKIMLIGIVQIMYEATRDRFAGYPDFADDSRVPFFDTTTNTNVYPLRSPPLPLDWEFAPEQSEQGNVNDTNHKEHVQNRWSWYDTNPRVSSASSFYFMQGVCDPREIDPNALSYYPNCTDANNDISNGGVVAPTPTNEQVARKAADLSPFLKALYEHHQEAKELGVFFANSGAGSSIMYPHYEINGTSSYTSIGCDWMKAPNPALDPIDPSRPIARQEEIDRCHAEGEIVPAREYNPLERAWCRDLALYPGKVQNVGPFQNAWNPDEWIMSAGRAVYDRVTGEFISCIYASFTVDWIYDVIDNIRISEWSKFTLVRWDSDGTVIVSPNFDYSTASETATVDDDSLDIGVTKSMFQDMKSLVDFSEPWNPQASREVYETTFSEHNGKLVSVYPIPAIPNDYDPEYSPEFMVILSVDREQAIDQATTEVEGAVDEEVKRLVAFTLIIGFVGLAVVLILIYAFSYRLTEPLKWMADVSEQIVGNFGEDLDTDIDYERKKSFRFSPKTELRELVQEFTKMVAKFSGEGTAKAVKIRPTEVRNHFPFFDEFRALYQSRKEPGFEYDYEPSSSSLAESDGHTRHFGPNVHKSDGETTVAPAVADKEHKVFASPLFFWIVALVVTPLLATTISISAVVLWNLSTELPHLVVPVKEQFLDLRERTRYTAATMRAVHASEVTARSARDLHVLTRLASWLFFGGVPMSGSITEMKSGTEECKSTPGYGTCAYFDTQPCDCAWNDVFGDANCHEYLKDSRFLEQVWFAGQSQDAWQNGDRNKTSFPDVDYSAETTAWWSNVDEVPGNEKGPLAAADYETSYDRLKVVSALSTVFVPLFQYDKGPDRPVALFVGFEADGMMTGYSGCDNGPADFSKFISSESNGAAKMRPDLCPIGRYGYDCRCRGWYDVGMKKAMDMDDAGPLYVTPPYKFANNDLTAQSASSPLVDPKTQTHIGQTLVDFLPDYIFTSLNKENTLVATGGFPILITPEKDSLGYDTVIGPGFSLEGIGKSIDELILPNDQRNCDEGDCANWQAFKEILDDMRAGNANTADFSRTASDGVLEKVHISYAPVVVKSYLPLDSSDFSRGVKEYDSLIYSLALAEPERGMLEPFQAVEEANQKQVNTAIWVLSSLIFVAALLLLYISAQVTASVTEPILHLLGLIRKINKTEIEKDDAMESEECLGSSCEMVCVYDAMEMLYELVRFANSAFFAGNLDDAHAVQGDALRMLQRLGNKKAIAIACNDLGNTMLNMYRTMKSTKEAEICGLSEREIVSRGITYFQQAIKLGEETYMYDQFFEEEGWSKRRLEFMVHLANRYFNRAMFLLTTKDDHPRPQEAMSLGFRDLQIVEDMDDEFIAKCVEVGFSVDKVERYELVMNRIRGLLTLAKMGYDDDLGVEEHIGEIFKSVKSELENPASELFDSIGTAGRMQELDVELIRYFRDKKKDTTEAARIGIRMLVEDDYVFLDAQCEALSGIADYVDSWTPVSSVG